MEPMHLGSVPTGFDDEGVQLQRHTSLRKES